MNSAAFIEDKLEPLSDDWLSSQRKRFEKNSNYNPATNTIRVVNTFKSVYKGECDEELYEIVEDVDETNFNEFCWFDEQRDELHLPNRKIPFYRPADAYRLVLDIFEFINKQFDLQSPFAYKEISFIEGLVVDTCKAKQNQCQPDLREFLNFFLAKFKTYLWRKYDFTAEKYSIYEAPDKLCFELKQNELVGLLYLIWKSDCVEHNDKTSLSHFYTYCERHFYRKNDGNDDFKPLRPNSLRNIFSKIDKNEVSVDKIFQKLKGAYEKQGQNK